MDLKYVFLKKKPSLILITLKDETNNWYPSKIAAYCGASYVHVTKFIDELKKIELVLVEKKGKQKIVKLTDKGKALAGLIEEIIKRLEQKNS
ncbi:MAG: hypothetical protein NC918_00125 [Candidatus Omnitrophica bacterium]|nr:hypothetical protein [Candidatus Omnitrophota bacterium]